ncbi:hypothetical protein OSB04_016575 [Centaurea solstitialis]|uniref:Reverse transcriptase Ty1/copia-type domain-containing protein n=1 Tax=Centaurea solstitialis TaxID=347529 RepID=A0AA38WHK4_9ASTR|nr:hypothetical protein OSB04_016575 [Centaurea solstitialis]
MVTHTCISRDLLNRLSFYAWDWDTCQDPRELVSDLKEEVYMKIPQGFSTKEETRVCILKKSIYGLKQASRNWYHKFTTALTQLGYHQGKVDHSLFIYKVDDVYVAALIYVDDVIIVGNNMDKIQHTKA